MKNKYLIFFTISLLFVGFSMAQEKPTKTIKVHFKSKKIIETAEIDPTASAQATKVEKSRLYLLSCFASSENGEGEIISNCIKLSDVSSIIFYAEAFALLNTQVRFSIIWLGPETVAFEGEWDTWNKNESALLGVEIVPTEWKKGVYTVIWIAEIKEAGAGVGLQKQCIVRFY